MTMSKGSEAMIRPVVSAPAARRRQPARPQLSSMGQGCHCPSSSRLAPKVLVRINRMSSLPFPDGGDKGLRRQTQALEGTVIDVEAAADRAMAAGQLFAPALGQLQPGGAGAEGGTVRREGEDSAVLDASGAWRNRFITARVEPSGEGFAASFREGNSLSRTGRIVSWSVSFILIASILAFFGSWWRLPCCLCIAALLFYVLTAPEDACRRRMQRIIHELGQ